MSNKLVITILVFLFSFHLFSQEYYYNNGNKVFVKKDNIRYYFLLTDTIRGIRLNDFHINIIPYRNKNFGKHYWALSNSNFININNELVKYISPTIININNDTLNFSNLFYVKLKEEKDLLLLESIANENNIEILGRNEFMPL